MFETLALSICVAQSGQSHVLERPRDLYEHYQPLQPFKTARISPEVSDVRVPQAKRIIMVAPDGSTDPDWSDVWQLKGAIRARGRVVSSGGIRLVYE